MLKNTVLDPLATDILKGNNEKFVQFIGIRLKEMNCQSPEEAALLGSRVAVETMMMRVSSNDSGAIIRHVLDCFLVDLDELLEEARKLNSVNRL